MSDVYKNREIDDLQRMCERLVAEKWRLRKFLESIVAGEYDYLNDARKAAVEILRADLSIALPASTVSSQTRESEAT